MFWPRTVYLCLVLTSLCSSVLSAIEFRAHLNYVNPARISPLDLSVRSLPGKTTRYHLYTKDRRPAICVSTVLCRESHILEPPPKGLRQKWISGVFHTQEWERTVGTICTSFGHDVLQAQLVKDAIQFTTRADFGGESCPSLRWGNRFPVRSSCFIQVPRRLIRLLRKAPPYTVIFAAPRSCPRLDRRPPLTSILSALHTTPSVRSLCFCRVSCTLTFVFSTGLRL